ncbi:hypothetical protein GOBAR_DD05185 [Gossypium barbadense]|nr:hypothetical protein GOBAR_DD05185 [Gossypium barbadense]
MEYMPGTTMDLKTLPYRGLNGQLEPGRRVFPQLFWTFDPCLWSIVLWKIHADTTDCFRHRGVRELQIVGFLLRTYRDMLSGKTTFALSLKNPWVLLLRFDNSMSHEGPSTAFTTSPSTFTMSKRTKTGANIS